MPPKPKPPEDLADVPAAAPVGDQAPPEPTGENRQSDEPPALDDQVADDVPLALAEPQYRVTRNALGRWRRGDVVIAADVGGEERAAELVARGALVEA